MRDYRVGETFQDNNNRVLVIQEPIQNSLMDNPCEICHYHKNRTCSMEDMYCSEVDREDQTNIIYITID